MRSRSRSLVDLLAAAVALADADAHRLAVLSSFTLIPTRVGRLQTGQTTITLATGTGAGLLDDAAGRDLGAAHAGGVADRAAAAVCRLTTFRFSTSTRRSRGRASRTRPCLPRSLPVRICTRSPFLTFIVADISQSTSGARLTIFMKFFSRSSRATGPKMRVPRGLFWLSMMTAAFSSKPISVPSSRP